MPTDRDLEKLLAGLRPAPPSSRCLRALNAIAADPAGRRFPRTRFPVAGVPDPARPALRRTLALSAAALFLAGIGLFPFHPRPAGTGLQTATAARSTPTSAPLSANIIIYGVTAEADAVVVRNGRPARCLRILMLQQTCWHDPASGARIELTAPHEEVAYLPVPIL